MPPPIFSHASPPPISKLLRGLWLLLCIYENNQADENLIQLIGFGFVFGIGELLWTLIFALIYGLDDELSLEASVCSWTPLIRSPTGKGKRFELTGVRITEVKISSMVLQGEYVLLRTSRDFELVEMS